LEKNGTFGCTKRQQTKKSAGDRGVKSARMTAEALGRHEEQQQR
jgi:hypothetical protein